MNGWDYLLRYVHMRVYYVFMYVFIPCFSLNDLVAVSDSQFYYTNYVHKYHFEFTLSLYWGSVGYYDGQKGRIASPGFYIPNGLGVSPDLRLAEPKLIILYLKNIICN